MTRTIALFVGSLRKDSFTKKVAEAIGALAPGLTFKPIDISRISPFNQDLEEHPPADWVELRDAVRPVDGLLFATPEYNRSVPGVLIGSQLSVRLPERSLRVALAATLLVSGIKLLDPPGSDLFVVAALGLALLVGTFLAVRALNRRRAVEMPRPRREAPSEPVADAVP